MKHLRLSLCIALIGSLHALPAAQAQKVYRCGNSYSQTPCASAESTEVPVTDARSADQKRDMDRATARTAQAADAMERNRLKQEEEWQKRLEADQKKAEARQSLEKKRQLLASEKSAKAAHSPVALQPPKLQKPKAPAQSRPPPSDEFRAVHRPPKP